MSKRALVFAVVTNSLLLSQTYSALAEYSGLDATVERLNQAVKTPMAPATNCCVTTTTGRPNLLSQVKRLRSAIKSEAFTAATCSSVLEEAYATVFKSSPEQYEPRLLKENAREIIDELFAGKLELRASLARIEKEGPLSAPCVEASRNAMRAVLFLSEYLAEHFVPGLGHDRVFEGQGPELLLNPKYGPKLELKSGDVLMSRGDAFVSGAISRIGDNDGNFSHIAIVYIDPETKKPYTVEAHIEQGVVVAPLENYLKDGKVRSTVFRQQDPGLAHQAAKLMFERASKATAKGKNIPYDFGMVLSGKDPKGRAADHEVFCSEVAYIGYKEASGGKIVLPRYPTGLNMKNDTFLKAIGVAAKTTFAPSDMEVETRFDLVAEWRNFKKTEKSRMTDAILTKSYEAMEKHDYALRNTAGDAIKRDLAYVMRHTPLFRGLVKDKFPENMTRKAVGTMLALDKASTPMLAKLKEVSALQKEKTGFAMTTPQMLVYLETLRQDDFQTYLNYRKWQREFPAPSSGDDGQAQPPSDPAPPKPLFHNVFRPKS